LKLEKLSQFSVVHGNSRHGKESREYRTWRHIRSRCRNKNNPAYKDYGGRGISVCDRWNSFANFLADMGPKPSPKHQIERIDNDGDYEPSNCRWATPIEQSNNRRTNHFITIRGRTLSIADWAREIDFPYKELRALVDYGEKLLAKNERTALTAARRSGV
jgi:hypothetical protein